MAVKGVNRPAIIKKADPSGPKPVPMTPKQTPPTAPKFSKVGKEAVEAGKRLSAEPITETPT